MKPRHRPLAAHRRVSIIAVTLSLAAFVLVLLVGISLPIVKAVYLLSLRSTGKNVPTSGVATELRFGVWGVCATGALNSPTLFTNNGKCFGPRLGYEVPPEILALIGFSQDITSVILQTLLTVMILHLVTAALSLLTLFLSLFLGSHKISIIALVSAIVTAFVGTIVFSVDLALVLTAQRQVEKLTALQFGVGFGNGIWMELASMVLTYLVVVLLSARACYCCGVRRRRYDYSDEDNNPNKHHHHHHHRFSHSQPSNTY
jgi:hypothetical protein